MGDYIGCMGGEKMPLYCEADSMITESDVEQKFIYPFLTKPQPMGLGLDNAEIFTKQLIRQRLIGKGDKQKYYYPDYIVMIRGIPTLIIEAKKPEESLGSGYAEARMYAHEVNASFSHAVNVCQYVIACNGREMWAGYYDQADPVIILSFDEFNIEQQSFVKLLEFCSKKKLTNLADIPYITARGNATFNSPVSQLGGKRVQNEEMIENSFGRTLVFDYRNIFDPETEEDRTLIVRNAYIASAKREQHIEPMYREILRYSTPSNAAATTIATEAPAEFVNKLSERIIKKNDAYSLMILIGNVGSGKTTFTRYFRQVFLANVHPELNNRCEWLYLNMNFAPVAADEIYSWVKKEIMSGILAENRQIDFENYEIIKKILKPIIDRFRKGAGSLLTDDLTTYNYELYKTIAEAQNDQDSYLEYLISFIKSEFLHIPIIVLDNCDKRNKEEQLLMFEVAQWLRTRFQCVVLLPMRDTTYDLYKNEPPLDTVVKDLVFRIDPPDLMKVLQARLDFITRMIEPQDTIYILENGIQVQRKKSELTDYFRALMVSIRKDTWLANIFFRLSDRNTRRGIQIFEDFCKSGHMESTDIFKIKVLEDAATVPTFKLVNVLLRKNRRYYNGEESNFINLFGSDYRDDFPDPFIRIDMLKWLQVRIGTGGLRGSRGFCSSEDLFKDIQALGHKKEVIKREVVYLIKRGLIYCDNVIEAIEEGDLVKIAPSGSIHLQMLNNVAYIAACAEDTLFKNAEIMSRISKRLKNIDYHSKYMLLLNAKDLVEYLQAYRKEYVLSIDILIPDDKRLSVYNMSDCQNAITRWIQNDSDLREMDRALSICSIGSIVSAKVLSKNNGGIVCAIGLNELKGFLSATNPIYDLGYQKYTEISVGDTLACEVMTYDANHKSIQLKFKDKVDNT